MTLKERLQADLRTAMKQRDEVTTATLRMALSAVTAEEVSGRAARTLSDAEVERVLAKEIKKRGEAAEAFAGGGRPESAARERAEAAVLQAYLPEPLSDAELAALVEAAVAEAGATGPAQMGAVMRVLTPRVAGRAPGAAVAAAVRARLAAR
jgi:hypothetical protein